MRSAQGYRRKRCDIPCLTPPDLSLVSCSCARILCGTLPLRGSTRAGYAHMAGALIAAEDMRAGEHAADMQAHTCITVTFLLGYILACMASGRGTGSRRATTMRMSRAQRSKRLGCRSAHSTYVCMALGVCGHMACACCAQQRLHLIVCRASHSSGETTGAGRWHKRCASLCSCRSLRGARVSGFTRR